MSMQSEIDGIATKVTALKEAIIIKYDKYKVTAKSYSGEGDIATAIVNANTRLKKMMNDLTINYSNLNRDLRHLGTSVRSADIARRILENRKSS